MLIARKLPRSQEKLPQGLSGLLPAVTLSGNTQYNDRDLQFRGAAPMQAALRALIPTALTSLRRTAVSLSEWITYQQAKNQVSQAEAVFLQANQDLIVRVAQAYFDVLLAENNVTLAAAQKAAFAEQLAQAKRNFESAPPPSLTPMTRRLGTTSRIRRNRGAK